MTQGSAPWLLSLGQSVLRIQALRPLKGTSSPLLHFRFALCIKISPAMHGVRAHSCIIFMQDSDLAGTVCSSTVSFCLLRRPTNLAK